MGGTVLEYCEDEGIEVKVNPAEYIFFAMEANGNVTLYHGVTGEVLMYAHDHGFSHIYPMEDCPESTLYRFENCETFSEWVETVASQWLSKIIE